MIVSSVLLFFAISLPTLADPLKKGFRIVAPPRPTYTGILQIPEPSHPFVAPGHKDLRGPCPGLNTLANHGYIPRNGVASFEQIVEAATHGFNMDYDLASGLTAFGMLARGNSYTDQLSIGLDTPLIPPLPGEIDGSTTRGLAAHGRFEGDVSMTRQDWAIGDNINFQPDLFAELLDIVAQVGNDSDVTGPKSIVNVEALSRFKLKRFMESQTQNVELQYHVGRLTLSYGETGFTLNFFANGTDGTLSVPAMTSIFRDQKFAPNWFRRSSPGTIDLIGNSSGQVFEMNPVRPGANALNGTYIIDQHIGNCAFYNNLAADNVPGVLLNTTGVLKENVDFLLNAIHTLFPNCPAAVPHGAANV
ncbi:Aromatic peroxygenase [Termitomyces sp. T112]|nr:Aromatic peroxygenase [Termitomyces sp. T112]